MNSDHLDHLGVLSWGSAQPTGVSRVLVYWSGLKDSLQIRWSATVKEKRAVPGAPRWDQGYV